MSSTLYEQFFAVGSVKSLLTGMEVKLPRKTLAQDSSRSESPSMSKPEKKAMLKQ